MDWIDVAQDRNQWRALVSTVMDFPRFPKNVGEILEELSKWWLLKEDSAPWR
jgi:hypothetical protein